MNKAFVMQMRVKKMAEKYQEEHPELSEKEVMEAVVLKVVGPEGVEKFNELIDKPEECKKIMKGRFRRVIGRYPRGQLSLFSLLMKLDISNFNIQRDAEHEDRLGNKTHQLYFDNTT